MAMEAGPLSETAYRKRTYSLTTPRQQRLHPSQLSSASLDEYTLMKARASSSSSSYPEDYGHVEVGSSSSSSSSRGSCGNLGDDGGGYMPMMAQGVRAGAAGGGGGGGYMTMSPSCVSAPKKILYSRAQPQWPAGSLEDGAYVKMSAGSSPRAAPPTPQPPGRRGDDQDEYVSMTPGLRHGDQHTPPPPDCFLSPLSDETPCRAPQESSQYMEMRPGAQDPSYTTLGGSSPSGPSALRQSQQRGGRLGRPSRLALEAVRTLPSMTEHPPPPAGPAEPRSPGEYINIDFSRSGFSPSSCSSSSSSFSPPPVRSHSRGGGGGGRRTSPLSDYMNLQMGAHSPKAADTPAAGRLVALCESSACPCSEDDGPYHLEGEGCSDSEGPRDRAKEEYTEMTFGLVTTPPQLVPHTAESSSSSRVARLSSGEPRLSQRSPGLGVFLLGSPSPPTAGLADPDRAAKVIRADPQGRRRHSSETFSSTATVTPVCPSFAPSNRRQEHPAPPAAQAKRHSSVENLSSRSSEGSEDEAASADFPNRLNYMTLDLREGGRDLQQQQRDLVAFKSARCCKGDLNGLLSTPYVCLGFTETATTAKD